MLNKNNIQVLPETFSIENVSLLDDVENIFISIQEKDTCCVVYLGWIYKCLDIETRYSLENRWVLQSISTLFSQNNISIFAFTTVDHGYFFFEEKFLNCVENDIIHLI